MKNIKKTVLSTVAIMLLALSLFAVGVSAKTVKNKTITGKVTSVSSSSISVSSGSKKYTVDVSSKTKITDKNGKSITLSNIKKGDKVKAKGTLSGKTLDAGKVKDTTRAKK